MRVPARCKRTYSPALAPVPEKLIAVITSEAPGEVAPLVSCNAVGPAPPFVFEDAVKIALPAVVLLDPKDAPAAVENAQAGVQSIMSTAPAEVPTRKSLFAEPSQADPVADEVLSN